MIITAPQNPIFAHSENVIYFSDVDKHLEIIYKVKIKGEVLQFTNKIYAYDGKCELNLSDVLKMFYFRYSQNPSETNITIDGTTNYNGGELEMIFTDFSGNTETLNFYIINGALQEGESFSDTNQTLNQIPYAFKGFPYSVTKWEDGKVVRYGSLNELSRCEGVYLSWLNKYGAYEFYLFDGGYEMDVNSSSLDSFKNYPMGKKSNRIIKIRTRIIEDLKLETVQKVSPQTTSKKITEAIMGIIESPEVYIFRISNKTLTSNGDFQVTGDWVKVKNITGNNVLRTRFNTTPMTFDVTLPDEKNITAI